MTFCFQSKWPTRSRLDLKVCTARYCRDLTLGLVMLPTQQLIRCSKTEMWMLVLCACTWVTEDSQNSWR